MRNLAHLAARLYGAPLMLLPNVADIFGNTFQQLLDARGAPLAEGAAQTPVRPRPLGFAANVRTDRFADKPYIVTDEGVGVLGIYGALLQRYAFDMNTCESFASYELLKWNYERMQADADVKAILLEFDSPGGEVAGNFELARLFLGARRGKPVWSHANEGAFSAAYNLAASTDRIVVPQAGSVGSIGVVMVHVDQAKRDEKMGLAYTFIYAGERKVDFNSHAPLGKKAMELATAEVVRLYDMFTGHVATARSLELQAVRDTEAGVFPANEAKGLGLVDDVASFDETLAELTELVTRSASFTTAGGMAAQHNHGRTAMSATTGAAPNTPAATTTTPPVGVPEAEVAQRTAAAAAEARTAERTRIGAILKHEAATSRPKLAQKLAFDTDMTPEAAVSVLEAAGVEQAAAAPVAAAPAASPLAAAMASAPNPAVGPDASAGAGTGADDATTAKNVVALFNQAKGGK